MSKTGNLYEYENFSKFTQDNHQRLLTSQVTIEDVIYEFEKKLGENSSIFEKAITRIWFGNWLKAVPQIELALEQYSLSEKLLEKHPSDKVEEILYQCLIQQAGILCFVNPNPERFDVFDILDRAINVMFSLYGWGETKSLTGNSSLKKATIIQSKIRSLEPILFLGIASTRYIICLSNRTSTAELIEALDWFRIAIECLAKLIQNEKATIIFRDELLKAFLFLTSILNESDHENLAQKLEELESISELVESLLFNFNFEEAVEVAENEIRNAPPMNALIELKRVFNSNGQNIKDELERQSKYNEPLLFDYEKELLDILRNLDSENQRFELGLARMLLGTLASYKGNNEESRDYLQKAYYNFQTVAPAYELRYETSSKLSEAFLNEGDNVASAYWATVSIAEISFNGIEAEFSMISFLWLSLASFNQGNDQAACFYAKVYLLGMDALRVSEENAHQLVSDLLDSKKSPLFAGSLQQIADVFIKSGRIAEYFHFLELNQETSIKPRVQKDAAVRAGNSKIILTRIEEQCYRYLCRISQYKTTDFEKQFLRVAATIRKIGKRLRKLDSENNKQVNVVSEDLTEQYWQQIPDDGVETAQIHYTIIDDDINIFVLTPSKIDQRKVNINKGEFSKLVYDFLKNILTVYDSAFGNHIDYGNKLYKILFAPIAELIKHTQRILISATGLLRFIPFNALHDGEKYLIETYTVINLPEVHTDLKSISNSTKNMAILGVGKGKNSSNFDLPEVGKEIDSILSLVPHENERIILNKLDEEFDRKSLTKAFSGEFEIVHIASHFEINPANVLESAIIIGNSEKVQLSELQREMNTQKTIDLLVLSACNTAISDLQIQINEPNSPQGVFHKLGCNCVISTLWRLNDEVASVIMENFYQNLLLNPNKDKAESLRLAQLNILREKGKFSHPYFWASFVISGNWLAFAQQKV